MPSPIQSFKAVRALGLRPSLSYARYHLRLKSGWLRRQTPAGSWRGHVPPDWFVDDRRETSGKVGPPSPLIWDTERLRTQLVHLEAGVRPRAKADAEAILTGEFNLFGELPVRLGVQPDWLAFPGLAGGGEHAAADRHWSAVDIDALGGDVKLLWEPSRFAWIYALGRAYVLDGDERYAERFWHLLLSWLETNPPNVGPHWVSGQEVAIRLIAMLFAWQAFDPWLERQEEVRSALLEAIAVHGGRIPWTLDYDRAQGNNHLIVEAAALYGAGALLPGLASANGWEREGRRTLEAAICHQFFADGGYVQHSVNYARLALQASLWAAGIAQRLNQPFGEVTLAKLRSGGEWLRSMICGRQGETPDYGPNDGAHLMPLSNCGYWDFRPTVQAVRCLTGGVPLPAGPWDELSLWLGLEPGRLRRSDDNQISSQPDDFPDAGLHLIGKGDNRGVLRCGRFKGRPGHSDQLHLDLWYRGRNVALDPGTYLYNGAAPWRNSLSGSEVHNTVVVDQREPMEAAGRFLWLNWDQGTVIRRERSSQGGIEMLAARRDGYRRLGIDHERTLVRLGESGWLVVDDIQGDGIHQLNLGWNLPPAAWALKDNRLTLEDPAQGPLGIVDVAGQGVDLALYSQGECLAGGGAIRPNWGWWSPTYAHREPCLRLVAKVQTPLPFRFVTRLAWGPDPMTHPSIEWRQVEHGWPPFRSLELGDERLEL